MEDSDNKSASGLWPLLEEAFEGILLAEPDPWRVRYANRAAAKRFEAPPHELIGRAIEKLFMDSSKDEILRRLDENLQEQASSDEPLLAALVTPSPDVEIAQIRCTRLVVDDAVLVGVLLDDTVTSQLDPLNR